MDKEATNSKFNWEKISLGVLLVFGIVFMILLFSSILGNNQTISYSSTNSDLINTKEISTLSVSEFVYNGIARTYKKNGDPDYNVLYRSTVKVSVDAEGIKYDVDEKNKTVIFMFPEFTVESPIIDIASLSVIPDRNDLYIDDEIKLCRSDALSEAKQSKKLISSAQENLKSIMKAWF